MNSLDTNILLYGINRDCPEHEACRDLIGKALKESSSWIVAEQVWFELYRLLRNPSVLEKPLSSCDASETVAWYRNSSGWLTCAWEPDMMHKLHSLWGASGFQGRTTFDAVLAVTLESHGVKFLYTRNIRDFEVFDFFSLSNPLV